MKKIDSDKTINTPKNQLTLYGFKNYFNTFIKLFNENKMPNTLLLNGPKGIGKATFLYHFFNYILSKKEENKYLANNLKIDNRNLSYNRLINGIHPNFFLIDSDENNSEIKINTIRNLYLFLSKSTYSTDLKIILIDNAQNLNLYSANALLKAIEEPRKNTFFFIVHDNNYKILETIKSRSIEFKIFLSMKEKEDILIKLINSYSFDESFTKFSDNLYFDTPGNILKYLSILNENNISLEKNITSRIHFFSEKYKKDKNSEILSYLSVSIQKFYNKLCLSSKHGINFRFFNYFKILKIIDDMKKFNLNDTNSFIKIRDIIKNEAK